MNACLGWTLRKYVLTKCTPRALSGDAGLIRSMTDLLDGPKDETLGGPITACSVLARGNPLEVPRYEVAESISKAASAS
jgi:hypothetical protein